MVTSPSLGDRIRPGWEQGTKWSVETTVWPDRARDSYADSSRIVRGTSTYEVLETPRTDDRYRVVVTNDTRSYLLHFAESYNLESVLEVLDRGERAWKTRSLHDSPTGGGPFLIREWTPSRPVFALHPGLTQTGSFARTNFTSGGRSTGNWMTQRVEKQDGIFRIVLEHAPTKTRVVFRWEPGEPWWNEARYYYRERLVMRALRKPDPVD